MSKGIAAGAASSGRVVQVTYDEEVGTVAASTALPGDDTIPQVTEGTEVLSVSHTPKKSGNILYVNVQTFVCEDANSSHSAQVALFKDGASNAVSAGANGNNDGSSFGGGPVHVQYKFTTVATSAITFTVRIGMNGTAAMNLNQAHSDSAGALNLGDVITSCITVTEVEV